MAIYEFQKEDGEIVCKQFPMGKCPKEIECDDGIKARRIFSSGISMSFKEGQETSAKLKSMNEKMRKANIEAGERGRKEWKQRMPKLQLG